MHVSPPDFRAARRDGIVLHYAVLGPVAFVMADYPASGSRGTFVEEWCDQPHWAVTARGDVEIDLDGRRVPVAPGTVFHVPGGTRHRFLAAGPVRVAGFEPMPPGMTATDEALEAAGFEIVNTHAASVQIGSLSLDRPGPERAPEDGEILATGRRMGDLLFSRARLGRLGGYLSDRCDVEHWGIVTAGAIAIESENDVEVLSAGDVFYCPPGPPGHRLQAAEPATVIDFSPMESIRSAKRVAEWRRELVRGALDEDPNGPLKTAALG